MKILFTIAHFCDPKGSGPYASQKPDPRPRIEALGRSITALHSVYGKRQLIRDFRRHTAVPVNQQTQCDINVVVCTTRDLHVLADLPVEAGDYTHHATNAEPLLLPFECQAVLRDNLGQYDYYCYLEDDVILHDPWFFIKLDWFCRQATDACLLLPNRFEVCSQGDLRKAYIDGDVKRKLTADFQDMEELPELTYSVLGQTIVFERPLNPNAGGYFLNARQMGMAWT